MKLASCWVLAMPAVAVAAPPLAYEEDFLHDAGYLEAGPIRIYPALKTIFGYDDNIFESENNTQSSKFTRLIPEIAATLPFNAGMVQIGAQADDQRFMDSSDDNFTDKLVYGRAAFEANHRNRFNVNAALAKSHDPRGTFLTEGFDPAAPIVDKPDAYTEQRAALKYEFGAPTAAGGLRFGASYLDHSYDNHRDRTRFFDREEYGASGTFLWRVQPRTSLALEARERKITYAETNPNSTSLDSREHTLLAGLEWNITGRTSSSLRLGNRRKDFDSPERVDGSDFVWEANASWAPRKYSKFELELKREPNETNGTGDFIDTRSYLLRWSHDWTPRIGTQLALSYAQQSYENADRESDTKGVKLGLNYKMRRWLTWRLDGAWRSRSSNVDQLSFDRNTYSLTAEFTL